MRLNLVTVVGDFHIPQTLVQMLKHYKEMVDKVHVIYYRTGLPGSLEEFEEYLRGNGVYPDEIHVFEGEKYDWDKVTELYNKVTTSGEEYDWWIISDCDELQYWPVDPREVAEECIRYRKKFVTGGFLDRIGEEGKFTETYGPATDLDEAFPNIGFFRYPMSGACPNKVVMVKSGQEVTSGQHYAKFPDGSTSWGKKHPLRMDINRYFIQVHHFKWDYSVLQRLKDTGESGCKYSEEYLKMREAIGDSEKIDIFNPEYRIERFNPEKGYESYSQWKDVRNTIIYI